MKNLLKASSYFIVVPVALILAFFPLTAEKILLEGATAGLRGLPVPYPYIVFPTFPSSQNNLIFVIDVVFWILLFRIIIEYLFEKKVTRKAFFEIMIVSIIFALFVSFLASNA